MLVKDFKVGEKAWVIPYEFGRKPEEPYPVIIRRVGRKQVDVSPSCIGNFVMTFEVSPNTDECLREKTIYTPTKFLFLTKSDADLHIERCTLVAKLRAEAQEMIGMMNIEQLRTLFKLYLEVMCPETQPDNK